MAFVAFGFYIVCLATITVGLSLASSVLFLRFRDLNQIWDMTTQAGFFLAPIVYPLGVIPERYHFYLYLWPPTPAIEFSRAAHGGRRSADSDGARVSGARWRAGFSRWASWCSAATRRARRSTSDVGAPLIEVDAVSKSFEIPSVRRETVREHLFGVLEPRKFERLQVLDRVSFELRAGETLGIMGRNGCGKSTLLKILCGIYTPDAGAVRVHTGITPILELGVGWNPELDAIDNVFLIGTVMGLSLREQSRRSSTTSWPSPKSSGSPG